MSKPKPSQKYGFGLEIELFRPAMIATGLNLALIVSTATAFLYREACAPFTQGATFHRGIYTYVTGREFNVPFGGEFRSYEVLLENGSLQKIYVARDGRSYQKIGGNYELLSSQFKFGDHLRTTKDDEQK